MDTAQQALQKHFEWKGKFEIAPVAPVENARELSLAYTPGVAEPCLAIQKDPALSYELTRRWNLVAVITDGTAVLGLGDIGPEAAMPVMEGKCILFKRFAGIDAVPLCVDSKDPDEIVRTVTLLSKSFGGVNLEDISAPRCFEIERRLKESCDIPVFHDDQHGTAIVVAAAMLNAMKIVGKKLADVRIVLNGPGAAGIAIAKLLLRMGARNLILCDQFGSLHAGREDLNAEQAELCRWTNPESYQGGLSGALAGADVFIGVSRPNQITAADVRRMSREPVVFAMANPVPEIMPDEAKAGGARVVGTGRSDFPNQINNLLAFPGVFAGALRVRARDITDGMKMAAAEAIAGIVSEAELREDYILPGPFDQRVAEAVASAVAGEAVREGLNRIKNGGK